MLKFIKTFCLNLSLAIVCSLGAHQAVADFTFSAPATNTKIKSCDDFATQEFNNGWDMSDSADINAFFPELDVKGFTNPRYSGGSFVGLTNTTSASFFLMSPKACGAYPIGGRYGENFTLDTTKYTTLSLRMNTDLPDSFGFRMIWNRDCNYAENRSVTVPSPIRVGWNTYSVDLNTIGLDTTSDTRTWAAGSITGLAILPTTTAGASISVDSIRLEDPNSCGTDNLGFNATTAGNDNLYSIWIDNDTNPFNGFVKQVKKAADATGNDTSSYNTLGMSPGNYYALALLDSDYASLELTNPWDMADTTDIETTINLVGGGGTFQNGSFVGTSDSTTPAVYLKVGTDGIDTSKYKYLSFKLSRSDNTSDMFIIWPGGAQVFDFADSVGNDTYNIDLSMNAGWTGTITNFIIRPALSPGVTFQLDWVSLRKTGYDTDRNITSLTAAIDSAAGFIVVNTPPSIEIKHPSIKGGEALKPWNMTADPDLALFSNLEGDADPNFPGENLTTYLPDVRSIDGVRGDFFKGTNLDGSFDPVNYSTYPFVANPITFDAGTYKNLCFKLLMDTTFSIGGGSVGRVFWSNAADISSFNTSEDLVLIYDGWSASRWYEYCVDMTKLHLDGTTTSNWAGTITAFRVDAHEFTPATTYYLDYIKLRKDDTSKGVYNIAFDIQDPEDTASVSLYYTGGFSPSGGTLITTLNEGQSSYAWDTTGIASGSYLIYAVATDAQNTITRSATGRLQVDNSGISGIAPVLSLEAPSEGQAVCSTLQVKGYAVQPDRFEDVSAVEVSVDGVLFQTIYPSLYSAAALLAYPGADSSNTGFNGLFDASAITTGARVVTVKAISSDGTSTTQTFNITKQATGCSDPIVDSDPAGSPAPIENLERPETTKPKIKKLSHNASDGKVTLTVTQAGDTNCSISVYGGETADTATTLIKTVSITEAMEKAKSVTLEAAKVQIDPKKVKKVVLRVTKDCNGFQQAEASKGLKIKTSRGLTTLTKVLNKLKKLKPKTTKKTKKKKR